MGIIKYILIYLAIGYALNLLGAITAPAKEIDLDPWRILGITCGWGMIALVLVWKAICYPIQLIARVRQRLAGGLGRVDG